jgi:3-oxoacyl-[acyl-carrier protein] reductase
MRRMKLEGKVALVVGASEAIGRVIATTFAEEGARTAICSRPRPEEPEVVVQLRQRGLETMWAPGDMTDPASMKSAVERVVESYGKLDILVVSGSPDAGQSDLFEAMAPSIYQLKIDAQLLSRLNCLHAALAPMIAQRYGKVVFITTDAGRTPTPGLSVSGAAGRRTHVLHALGRQGTRAPRHSRQLPAHHRHGRDAAIRRHHEGTARQSAHQGVQEIESKTPFRLTVPADIAKAALFLASPDSDQISGTVISINGGLTFP